MAVQETGSVESGGHEIGRVGAAHEDFAVGEVDHPQDAVHHGVAHGDEGVDAPLGQTEDDEIEPVAGRCSWPAASVAAEPTMIKARIAPPISHMTISVAVTRLSPSLAA